MSKNKSEIIAQALEAKQNATKPVLLDEGKTLSNIKIVRNSRQATRPSIVKIRETALNNQKSIEDMMDFVRGCENIYLTFGGVGDVILLLAEAYTDPLAKIVFFGNGGSKEFGEKFLNSFKVQNIVLDNIFGSSDAHKALNMLQNTGRLQISSHLPDGLDYGDWIRDNEKYVRKIKTKTNWIEKFGTDEETIDKKVIIFAPSGSYRSMHKQKYLEPYEAEAVAKLYINRGFTVYMTGNESDKYFYQNIRSPKVFWLTSDRLIDYKNHMVSLDFNRFIRIINSGVEYCSTDTWLKTYSCLIGKPTKVFDNRYHGKYAFGTDSGDLIFLNQRIWPTMRLCRVEEFIKREGLI